jgi:hypothetical protein
MQTYLKKVHWSPPPVHLSPPLCTLVTATLYTCHCHLYTCHLFHTCSRADLPEKGTLVTATCTLVTATLYTCHCHLYTCHLFHAYIRADLPEKGTRPPTPSHTLPRPQSDPSFGNIPSLSANQTPPLGIFPYCRPIRPLLWEYSLNVGHTPSKALPCPPCVTTRETHFGEQSGNICRPPGNNRGTFVALQGIIREHSSPFREQLGNIRRPSGNNQRTFVALQGTIGEHSLPFREQSGNIRRPSGNNRGTFVAL